MKKINNELLNYTNKCVEALSGVYLVFLILDIIYNLIDYNKKEIH